MPPDSLEPVYIKDVAIHFYSFASGLFIEYHNSVAAYQWKNIHSGFYNCKDAGETRKKDITSLYQAQLALTVVAVLEFRETTKRSHG
jgi:hypothetical protein